MARPRKLNSDKPRVPTSYEVLERAWQAIERQIAGKPVAAIASERRAAYALRNAYYYLLGVEQKRWPNFVSGRMRHTAALQDEIAWYPKQ